MTGSLPTGTVTFVFTDVEGSTELLGWGWWNRLRPRLGEVSKPTRAKALISASFISWRRLDIDAARECASKPSFSAVSSATA